MQTHKNIEESCMQHTGYCLTPAFKLYRAGGEYYISVEKKMLRRQYPAVHDSIFLSGGNEPVLRDTGTGSSTIYHSISRGTALVLQKSDGYAELSVLSDELRQDTAPWLDNLPAGASPCTTQAEIAGEAVTWVGVEDSSRLPVGIKALSAMDRVLIDWPGTLLYNVSIPIMAPFVFFHEFLNEE